MAERGVNGASSVTLNERFIKCAGCNVNVPKDDMIALGKCTVCGRVYEPVVLPGGDAIAVEFVAFSQEKAAGSARENATSTTTTATNLTSQAKAEAPRRKRWVELQSRKGRTYYHNTETGEDRWDKPADIDAEAVDDAFVPFKNDFVKKAVMLEQTKLEATKLGVPIELVTAAHEDQSHAEDPLSRMSKRALDKAESSTKQTPTSKPAPKKTVPDVQEEEEEREEEFEGDSGDQQARESDNDGSKCLLM